MAEAAAASTAVGAEDADAAGWAALDADGRADAGGGADAAGVALEALEAGPGSAAGGALAGALAETGADPDVAGATGGRSGPWAEAIDAAKPSATNTIPNAAVHLLLTPEAYHGSERLLHVSRDHPVEDPGDVVAVHVSDWVANGACRLRCCCVQVKLYMMETPKKSSHGAESVGVAELRANLAKYLKLAASGRPVIVRERGRAAFVLTRYQEPNEGVFGCMRDRTRYTEGVVLNADEPWSPRNMP